MRQGLSLLLGCIAAAAAFQASAQVRLFEHDGYSGRSVNVSQPVRDLTQLGFNDRASSVVVRGGRWTLCDHSRFGGRCVNLRPGRYPSLSAMGLNDRVSSLRPAGGPRR